MGGRATLRDWRHSRPFCHWGLSREVASDGIPCAREKRCRQRSHARALCEKVELRFHRTRVEDCVQEPRTQTSVIGGRSGPSSEGGE